MIWVDRGERSMMSRDSGVPYVRGREEVYSDAA
jgi:hypothetical protein